MGGNSQIIKVGQLNKAKDTFLSGANLTFLKDRYLHQSDLDGKMDVYRQKKKL